MRSCATKHASVDKGVANVSLFAARSCAMPSVEDVLVGDQGDRIMKTNHATLVCMVLCALSTQACMPRSPGGDSSPILPGSVVQSGQSVPTSTPSIPTPSGDPYSEVPREDREVADSVRLCIGDGPILQKLVVRRTSRDTLDYITGASGSGSGYNGAEILWVIAYVAGGVTAGSLSGPFGNPAAEMATSIAASTPVPDLGLSPTAIVLDPNALFGADGQGLTMGICAIVAESGEMTGNSVFPPQVAGELLDEIRALPTVQHP